MGNPFDQFDRQAAGTNPFDKFDDPVPEQEQGGFVPAFKRTIGNMASTAGVTGEDVLGKNSITSGLQEWGKGVEEANKPGITSLSDIPKKPGTYVTESLANMGAQLAPQGIAGVAGRVIGGLAGGRLGGRPGALAGQEIGGRIAQAIPTFVQEYGGIRQEQNDSADPKDVNKLRAVAAAIPATAIEFAFGPQKLLARFLDGATREQIKELAKQPTKEIIKGLGKEFVKGGLGEASEEYPQKMLEKWGANKDPLSKEAQNEALFSAAMAIPGGGIMQGGMSAYETAKAARQNAAEQQSVPPAPPTNPLLAQATQEFSPQPGSTSQLDQTPTSFDVPKTLPPSGPLSGAVGIGRMSGAIPPEPVLRERDFVPPPSGSYGQLAEFEGLLNGERADKQSRVSDLLSGQAVQAASEAESQQAMVEAAQAQQSAQARYNLLQQVADTLPGDRNLKRAFGRALKEAGYSNLDFTPEETASIDNFNQINRSAGIAANIGPGIEPSTPNELDASQFIKEKGAKPEPKRHASNLENRIHELELQIEQYGMTPERESEIVGLIDQLDAQVAAKKKGIAAPTQTYGAQPTRTTPLLQTATNLGLPDVAQAVKTKQGQEKEQKAPAANVAPDSKEPWKMSSQEYDSPVEKEKREIFYVRSGSNNIEVIRNPSGADLSDMKKEFRREFPNATKDDPALRHTEDVSGNSYYWKGHLGAHQHIEPEISKRYGVAVNQNAAQKMSHRYVVRRALYDGFAVPDSVIAEYPGIIDEVRGIEGNKLSPKPAPAIEQPTLPPESSANPAVAPQQAQKGPGLSRVDPKLLAAYESAKASGNKAEQRRLAKEINAQRIKQISAAKEHAPVVLSLGSAPNSAEPITVKDGVVHVGNYPAQNFDTGENITVENGATPQQIKAALSGAGAIGRGQKVFGLPKESAPNSQAIPDGSTPQDAAEVKPNSSTELTGSTEVERQKPSAPAAPQQSAKEAPAETPKTDQPSDDGMDAMFEDAVEEAFGKAEPAISGQQDELDAEMRAYEAKAEAKSKKEKADNPRSATKSAASATKNATMGMAEVAKGLNALFKPKPGTLSMGVGFSQETYEAAKPYFAAGISHFKQAGADIKDMMLALVKNLRDQFGMDQETVKAMQPYVVQYMREVRDGKIVYDEVNTPKEDGNDPSDAGLENTLDNPLAEGQRRKRAYVAARGIQATRYRPGRADGRIVRGTGRRAEGKIDAVEEVGDGGRSPDVRDGQNGVVAGDVQRVSADYRPGIGGLTREGSWFDSASRNIDLIELAIKIDGEKRNATPEEQALLSKYVGFGAGEIRNYLFPIPPAYAKSQEPNRLIWPSFVREARWKPLAERIEALPREWQQSILQSTQYAHYTSEGIIRSMWSAIQKLGFTGGKIFEPGTGIGSFSMLMPDSVHQTSVFTGVEFDAPTALIARLLSPDQHLQHGDFIKRKFPKNFFDVNIGNPPFSQTPILGDSEYAKRGFMLHDFFFAKGIDLVRPGGLQVFVTSKGTMDKLTDKARKYLSERADLVGAIRLPSTAFEGNAGTSVVTDVIFLRKRADGEAPAGQEWGKIVPVETKDGPVMINEYFANHPEMVLGQNRISGNTDDLGRRVNSNGRGGEQYTVVSYDTTPAELDAKFAQAVERLPENIYSPLGQTDETVKEETRKVDFDPSVKREGVVYLAKDGTVMRVSSGIGVPLESSVKLSDKDKAWFKSYVELRNLVQLAREAQINDAKWEGVLKKLNKAYDAFRATHGPINDFTVTTRKATAEDGSIVETQIKRFKNKRLYREDYDAAILTTLETITESGEIIKAPFLLGRTIGKPVVVDVKSIGDALAVSLDAIGTLNLEDIGRRMKLGRDETIEAMGGQIFKTNDGNWQLADEYLSGNVVDKLEEAEQAAQLDPSFKRNVEALKEVQPEKLGPSQISAKLGAAWIPESHVNEFATEIGAGSVTYDHKTETWQVDGGNKRTERRAGAEYGTAARSPSELLEAILNSRSIKVMMTVDKKTVPDVEATTAANEMAKKIKDKFRGWVWTDSDRATDLVESYNKRYNNIAPRKFDGTHLTLPGVSLRFKLHPHQLRSIWRQIQTGNTYLAHAVGAGKTIEMIAGGMEQKRLGLIKKPMYVVPNHMLEQFSNEFMELYPLANIMVADDENFSAERRKAFIASATLNSPDAIIITHSAFKRIGVSEESVAPIRDEILADLEIELSETAKDQGSRVRRGQLEQQIEAVKQRFDAIVGASGKDSTIKFEDIGADFIYADEAHAFRKLDFHTAQSIKGIDPNGSQAAMDMYVKTRIMEKGRPGRSFVFASGTPVTNTMGELYTILRFFAGAELDRAGISTFDSWARMFGEVAPALEPNAAGRYELIERFAKFDNVPELMSRVRQFMDVLTSENLGALVKRPDLKGGKPNLNIVESNDALEEYMRGELATRIEISKAWKPSKEEPNNPDPIVAIITDGRFAAIDPRFFGGKLEGESIITTMGDKVAETYHATKDNIYYDKDGKPEKIKGSTQIVFYNLGFGEQSQKNRGFNSRAAFTKRLTDGGIPRSDIAWFDDANTDAKKEAVFKDMRSGKLKVLIGSAKKMGTGVNVQKRLITLHYQDPPWFPADVEQPHGRIIRQGNQNKEVSIEWYTTKGTYQSTMWQMVGRKQRFIDQAFTGDKSLRSMDDMGEASLFEQAAAVASGDPRAIQLAGLRQDVERFERLQAAHASEQINVSSALRSAEYYLSSALKRVKIYTKAYKAIGEKHFSFESGKVGNSTYNKVGEFGQAIKDAFNKEVEKGTPGRNEVKIGSIGDAISLTVEAVFAHDHKTKQDEPTGNYRLGVDVGGASYLVVSSAGLGADVDAVGLGRQVTNKVNEVDRDLRAARADVITQETDVIKLKKKRGAPFEYQQEMAEKYGDLKRLEAELQDDGKTKATAVVSETTMTASESALTGALPDEQRLVRYDDQDNMARNSGALPGESRFNQASDGRITPSDKAIYGMAAEGKNAKDILKFIAASSRNPFYRQLARLLLKTGIAPKITVGDGKGFTFNAGNDKQYAASYNPKTDTVSLFRPASSERHALHEFLHAATIKALSKNGMASVQMRALFNHVKATGKMNGMYGMENVDEFVAEVFSNPKFQELLKQIAAPEGSARKTVWDRFISVIRGILGLKTESHDALSRALSLGLGVMHENMKLSEGKSLTAKGNVGAGSATINVDGVERPRLNSNGKPIAQTDEGIRNFWKWFSGSKITDDQGRPLVVYHGTNADFSEFKVTRGGEFGPAIYMTDNKREAGEYGDAVKGVSFAAPSAHIMPSFVRLENPYTKGVDAFWKEFGGGTDADGIELAKAAGYDGVVAQRQDRYYDNDAREFVDRGTMLTHYVAFSPSQIKSATGNNGQFSPDNNDIRYNVIGDSGRAYDQAHRDFFKNVGRDINPESRLQKSLNYLRNDFWKKMAVGIVDQFRGLKDLGDNGTAYMLARLSKGTAGAFDTLLHHGKLMLRDGVYDGDTSGGFVERLGVPLHGELDDVLWWIAANRAWNLAPLGKENLFSPSDIAAGKSLANGTTAFDYTIQTGPARGTVTRNRSMIYADAHRVFNEFQKNTLDMAEQSGLIDGNSRKTWESEFYVPFYRVSEEDGEFVGAKISGSLVRKRAFQKLKGGTDKLNSDLLSNTLQNWAHLITASAQNRAARASLAAAENIGVAQRVAPDMASYSASNGTMLPPGTKKTVWFQENGKKVEYLVTDPFVMTAITSLEYAGMRNGIMDAMTKFKHALTIGVTASPAFKVRNLIRDSLQAIGTSDLGYNPIKNVTEGYKQTRRDSQEYVSALASGGLIRFGTMLEGSESSRVRQLIKAGVKDSTILNSDNKWQAFYDKVIDPAVSAYNELGNRSEEINRAALYNQLIKQGKSHAEAALLARDLMDFSMQGSFNTIRFLSQVVPFFNARLQGMYKLGRAARDDPKKMAVVTGALALASIALMAGYHDDDDWKRREDWDRDNYWWFKLGGIEYRIPKPFELGAVATLAERSVEYLTNDEMTGERFRNVIGKIAENNLSMNPVPQMVKPIIDLYANKDSFTGRPIETMGMQRLDSDMRFNSNTSMPARALSTATLGALSPVQYDHLVRAYFGWIGATAVSSADMAARVFMNEPTKPAMDYWKVTTQGMMKEQGSGSSRYLTLLYDQASELEQAYGTYRQLLKDGKFEDAKDYYESNADKLKRYKFVNSVKSMETKLNASIRSIERSDASAEEKKARIERVQAMKERVAKRVAPGLQ